jgi:hypothetical protein
VPPAAEASHDGRGERGGQRFALERHDEHARVCRRELVGARDGRRHQGQTRGHGLQRREARPLPVARQKRHIRRGSHLRQGPRILHCADFVERVRHPEFDGQRAGRDGDVLEHRQRRPNPDEVRVVPGVAQRRQRRDRAVRALLRPGVGDHQHDDRIGVDPPCGAPARTGAGAGAADDQIRLRGGRRRLDAVGHDAHRAAQGAGRPSRVAHPFGTREPRTDDARLEGLEPRRPAGAVVVQRRRHRHAARGEDAQFVAVEQVGLDEVDPVPGEPAREGVDALDPRAAGVREQNGVRRGRKRGTARRVEHVQAALEPVFRQPRVQRERDPFGASVVQCGDHLCDPRRPGRQDVEGVEAHDPPIRRRGAARRGPPSARGRARTAAGRAGARGRRSRRATARRTGRAPRRWCSGRGPRSGRRAMPRRPRVAGRSRSTAPGTVAPPAAPTPRAGARWVRARVGAVFPAPRRRRRRCPPRPPRAPGACARRARTRARRHRGR